MLIRQANIMRDAFKSEEQAEKGNKMYTLRRLSQ